MACHVKEGLVMAAAAARLGKIHAAKLLNTVHFYFKISLCYFILRFLCHFRLLARLAVRFIIRVSHARFGRVWRARFGWV